jgi:hypothetical protein
MEFKFVHYTEITDYAFKVNPTYKSNGYVRFFICPDVWDFWFVRILKGYENDEEEGYVENPDNYILERNKIEMDRKGQNLTMSKLKQIIEEDDGSNWDLQQGYDIEKLVDMLDDGCEILNRKEIDEYEKKDNEN